MSDLAALPPAVRSYVRGYVTRDRRLALARRAGLALTVLLVWVLLWCGADRFIQMPAAFRLAALLAGAVTVLAMLAGPLRRWIGPETDWIAVTQEIERQNPRFQQRLVTITSRLLGRPEHRGSDEILEHLVYQVDREVIEQRAAAMLPLRSAAGPWIALVLTLAAAAGLCFVPGLGLPRLAARFAVPWAAFPPVTTASLSVSPGDVDVAQSSPLNIDADVQRVEGGQVWLNVSTDGKTWSRSAMTGNNLGPGGDGRYSFTLASVDRDLQYVVSGGDARSRKYAVRVLRRPAVSEFCIRYTYPAYTGKPPLSVTNADGIIEAPVGTEALVTITCTEPLQLALLTVPGGEKALLSRVDADNVRQGHIVVQREGRYQLDLVSTREVTGGGPPTAEIRAQPDRPPVIRLAEAGATLQLNPGDILPLSYEALDDYGIDSITVRVQKESGQAYELPVYPGDASQAGSIQVVDRTMTAGPTQRSEAPSRRVGGQFDLDLAGLPLTIGDVLTIVFTAKDTGGQSTPAAPVRVLVSSRSVGPETYDRLADLADASRLADALAEELAAAIKSADVPAGDARINPSATVVAQRDRHLSAALESAAMARRAMLRAVAHGASPRMSVAIAALVDAAQTISSRMSKLLRSQDMGSVPQGSAAQDSIRHASDLSLEIQSNLKTICQGEHAAAVLADLESLAAAEAHSTAGDDRTAEHFKQALNRMRREITAGGTEIGLDANTSDFEAQLRSKVAAADSVVSSKHDVDFAAVARDFAQSASFRRPARERDRRGEVSERLLAGAEAEAVRHDADLIRSGDLHLASRAASMLTGEPSARMNELAGALSDLQHDHALNRRYGWKASQATSMATTEHRDDALVREAAKRARQQLAAWAGAGAAEASTRSSPATIPSIAAARAEQAESLAMLAGAESAQRRYADGAETDRTLLQAVDRMVAPERSPGLEISSEQSDSLLAQQRRLEQTGQEVSRVMKSAEKIDGLSDGETTLVEETRLARDEAAPGLADRQRGLADQISQMTSARPTSPAAAAASGSEDPNWRDRAITALLSAQVQLSAMPRQLTETLTAADDWRRAVERAKSAHRDANAASGEHKPAADRAADQADQDTTDASHRLQQAAAALGPATAETLALSLQPFAPEAAASRTAVADVLAPALKSIGEAFNSDDPSAATRSAASLRQAIETVQVELARARDEVAERDPLVAAKWFARSAADALGRRPPDFPMALKDQDLTTAALAHAWDASVHRAAVLRLAELPAMHAIYAPEPIAGNGSRLAGGARPAGDAGAPASPLIARGWRRLAPRDGDTSATPHQADPAGYEAALRAYFEALGGGREK